MENSNLVTDKTSLINKLIAEIFDNSKSVKAIVVADEGGLPVASKIFNAANLEDMEILISAVISTLINTGSKISLQLGMGEPTEITMKLDNGFIIIKLIRERACCGLLLEKSDYINIPFFEIKIDEFVKKIDPVLFPGN